MKCEDDQSHAEKEATYRVLEGLIQRAKLEGFIPFTDLVLMESKETSISPSLFRMPKIKALSFALEEAETTM
ncbi:hypothetical protein RJT34_24219 [Clitoria ternatea]|uniref:Uncharacterized protein n=1 Tax=Clitoria ternatea TaxID=43366 RepID=A0AAN9IFP2_CLITE